MIARQIDFGSNSELVEDKPKKKNKDEAKAAAIDKKDPKNTTTKSKIDKKSTTQGSKEKTQTGGDKVQTSSKFHPASKVKKEVEENPFKKLIDISDLMEFESNQGETLKEIQNILLRHNSELKQWYKSYSRKFEVHKCEESFAMTMKQVWRFLRDTRLISANSTIAQFNRVYFQGSKNDFMMLNSDDKAKFDLFYGNQTGRTQAKEAPAKKRDVSDDEDEDEGQAEQDNEMTIKDIHDPLKLVLQRQFFDAVVRAAYVKFLSGEGCEDLPNLSLKLDHVFNNNLCPLATKNRSKTQEEDKAFKMAVNVLGEYEPNLFEVFQHFSGKLNGFVKHGKMDATIQVHQVIEMLKTANLLESKVTDLKLIDIIFIIEKYYDPAQTLKTKLSEENFQKYLDANPDLIPVDVQARYKAAKEAAMRAN